MEPTILIIDDNEDDIVLTKMVLSKIRQDIKPEVAISGEAGLNIIRENKKKPKVILLDMNMPGMNGVQVLHEIRKDCCLKSLPVIVVTHSTLESDKEAAMKAGANRFLHKAADLNKFTNNLEYELECLLGNSV
jgi:CheY-like chemotaxis protein